MQWDFIRQDPFTRTMQAEAVIFIYVKKITPNLKKKSEKTKEF